MHVERDSLAWPAFAVSIMSWTKHLPFEAKFTAQTLTLTSAQRRKALGWPVPGRAPAIPTRVLPSGRHPRGGPWGRCTSTVSNFYTGLKFISKSHFYGRAAAEENFSDFLSALLRTHWNRAGILAII